MPVSLHVLGGGPATEAIRTGWATYQALPEPVQTALWGLIASGLVRAGDPRVQEEVRAFCEAHAIDEERLAPALQTCGLLLGQAAALGVARADFRQDLETLSDGNSQGHETVLGRYDAILGGVRESMVVGSLADHGKVLIGLDWRVDRVSASSRAARLDTDVIYLTLRYREGDSVDRVTLQLSTKGVRDLRAFLQRFES